MKKLLLLILLLVLGTALAACGDGKVADENSDGASPDEIEDMDDGTDGAGEPASEDNEFFNKVTEALNAKGMEFTIKGKGFQELFTDSTDSILYEVNGEDALLLQIYEIDPSSEFLAEAKDTGEFTIVYMGEKDKRPVTVVNNYVVFLGIGHPNYEEIISMINELN